MPDLKKTDQKFFGSLGENYAVSLLKKKGYRILEKNFRTKLGEIDIIALDRDTLVFVEVKARWSRRFGRPEEAVTPQKINKIKKAIGYYKLLHQDSSDKMRIEVVSLEIQNGKLTSEKIIPVC